MSNISAIWQEQVTFGRIILIAIRPVSALTLMLQAKQRTINTNFIVFGWLVYLTGTQTHDLPHLTIIALMWMLCIITLYTYSPGEPIWLSGLRALALSAHCCGKALFISLPHVTTLMFIWPARRKFFPEKYKHWNWLGVIHMDAEQ